jgi:predicted acetyltransferase
MKLIRPTLQYAGSWKLAMEEFEAEGIGGFWNVPTKPVAIEEYIQRTSDHSEGKNLPDYWMQATTFWLIDNEEFVGHANLRHVLVDWSEKIGGHIGYAIRASARGKGYGMKILELVLPEARRIGLSRALLTCDDANGASIRIIEKNGGQFQDVSDVKGKMTRRYWIDIPVES